MFKRDAFKLYLVLAVCLLPAGTSAAVVAQWVELGAGTTAEIRAVTTDKDCPKAKIDGKSAPMTVRAAAVTSKLGAENTSFPTVCSLPLPAGTKKASIGGKALPLPVADPKYILVLGDTGCRIKAGKKPQDCNKPKKWPFQALAAAAANLKPDLVLHVGDYVYREAPCPDPARCGGSPWGDNWDTWSVDFFAPAAPLLSAAPWINVRGNHENCAREGSGYFRLLAAAAYGAGGCPPHLPLYAVTAGSQTVAVMDTAIGDDAPADPAVVSLFQKDYSELKAISQPLWLATHRPAWGIVSATEGGSLNLVEAAGDLTILGPVSLFLAGHIHAFEALNYDAKVAPQIVAGHGGDKLDDTVPPKLDGLKVGTTSMSVQTGLSVAGFGFLTMKRKGDVWSIQLYDSAGTKGMKCSFESGHLTCQAPN